MIKVNDKKTAIIGGVVGIVMLLTIFCCEGKQEEAVIEEAVIEEVAPAVEEVTPAETVE